MPGCPNTRSVIVLQPSDIILHGGGFVLHRDLAIWIADVVSDMDHLLCLASAQCKLSTPPFIGQTELMVLTSNAGFTVPATQNQIVWNWIVIINKLYIAMKDLRSLYKGRPVYILGCERPSMMPRILASLTPSLLVKLPADFLAGLWHLGFAASCRVHLPLQDSRAPLTRIETGGLVSSQMSVVIHAAGAAKSVSPSRIGAAAVDTPLTPSLPCMSTAAPVTPPHSREASSVELRGISAKPTKGLDHLAFEYMAGADSVCQQATDIANQCALRTEDIVDRVGNTVTAMQSLLTRTSSNAGRQTCFIVDPHDVSIRMFRGVGSIAELRCAWDGFVERLRITHSILDLYQLGRTNSEREACDAAAQRRVEDAARRACQTSEARKCRGPPDNAQAATGRKSPPATSLLLAAARASITAGSPQPPSHLMENRLRIGERAKATEHAPTVAATPAAVKDPTYKFSCVSLHTSACRVAAARTSSRTLEPARAAAVVGSPPQRSPSLSEARTRINKSVETIRHAPARAVPAAVKDPPLVRVAGGVISLAPPRGVDEVVVKHGGLKSTHEHCVVSKGEEARTLHLLACTSSVTRPATVDRQPPAMAAKLAAVKDPWRKDVAAKVEGLEPNARGIDKYLPGPRGIESLTASLSEHSLEKPFVAEATQFPAPSHVLEDVIVELGGLSIADATLTVDPLELEDAINQQRIALKEDKCTSDSCGRSSFLLQAPSPAATLQSPPFVVDHTARVVSEYTETNVIQHEGLLGTMQLSSNAPIRPRMDSPVASLYTSISLPVSPTALDYMNFVLVSTILRTFTATHLDSSSVGDGAPCRVWEREGIGTCSWN
ncbi:hypothetical protein B0H14DRAFT_3543140 [Mycena olivaceomarginata]|nr:hypothetical protein B0H14DRAFT_3543140 [Mycena olivaceomarginata]